MEVYSRRRHDLGTCSIVVVQQFYALEPGIHAILGYKRAHTDSARPRMHLLFTFMS